MLRPYIKPKEKRKKGKKKKKKAIKKGWQMQKTKRKRNK
jgi:hypothetical protein